MRFLLYIAIVTYSLFVVGVHLFRSQNASLQWKIINDEINLLQWNIQIHEHFLLIVTVFYLFDLLHIYKDKKNHNGNKKYPIKRFGFI